jgi:hypothetical protein
VEAGEARPAAAPCRLCRFPASSMKAFLKKVIPLSFRLFVLRGLRYFPDQYALSLPLPTALGQPSKPCQPQKMALVSYVTAPFKEGSGSTLFTHVGIPKLMVRALHELGYSVDVIEWSNTVFTPRKDYSLFIGHAGRNFERITSRLSQKCTKIYFSTGTYWEEHNRLEEQRFAWLEQRRGVRLPYDRWINSSEERANEIADGIICLGNHAAKESYRKFPVVLHLNNATYDTTDSSAHEKDHHAARNGFLFLSSEGNVHKGLDLVLEAFSQPELQSKAHLYICQKIRPDFLSLYRRELEDMPNIHFIGHLNLRSAQFQELIQKCSFMIHPSCAEGQPGAVLDCIGHGLIPVLTRENHVDIDGYGFTLAASIPEIADTVLRLSQLPAEECSRLAANTRQAAAQFSETEFFSAIKRSIQTIIDAKTNRDRKASQNECSSR